MNTVHQKIVDAILEKAQRECPGVLDLLGVYGSVCTGDVHDHSDLDLLILINDPKGWALSKTFILDDEGIGYDIYCTTWEDLEDDARCGHAHLSKLMDSEVLYVRDDSVKERLGGLKDQAREILSSSKRFEAIAQIREELCKSYGHAFVADTLGQLRGWAAYMISLSLDALMLWNGTYFKRGVKRTFEELEGLDVPDDLENNVMRIVKARNYVELGISVGTLFKSVMRFTERRARKDEPTQGSLAGTYEEAYSNWKNKMPEAAERGDAFASFMNLASLQYLLDGVAAENDIPRINALEDFDTADLSKNAQTFDDALEEYRQEYVRLGMDATRYANVEEFVKEYLG